MMVYLPNFPSSVPPRAYLSWVRNQLQLGVSSTPTIPKAMGYMLLLASLPVAARICAPVVSFMKHPSKPMKGLHPSRKPSLGALRQKKRPWNLGPGCGFSFVLVGVTVVTMHLDPGLHNLTVSM